MKFVSIDVETANPDQSSICQIGFCEFADGNITNKSCMLINPEDVFEAGNIRIHGITSQDVSDAPTFPHIYELMRNALSDQIVASHSGFDRLALSRAIKKYELAPIESQWLDTTKVVRATWKDLKQSGFGLKDTAKYLDIDFQHHDAGEDARVCGEILVKAIEESGISLSKWLTETQPSETDQAPRAWRKAASEKREANPDGPLFGEVVVFTGELTIDRDEAADMAAKAGCEVASNVTKKTTLLIVGDQDNREHYAQKKSGKHRKAEEYIAKGQPIKIVWESDFKALVDVS